MSQEEQFHNFLKTHKTDICLSENPSTPKLLVYVNAKFTELKDFVKLTNISNNNSAIAEIYKDSASITVNTTILGYDKMLSDYKDCFDKKLWSMFEDDVKEMEQHGISGILMSEF